MFCSDVIARGVAERGRSRTIRPERSRQFTALSPWRALGYIPAAAVCPVDFTITPVSELCPDRATVELMTLTAKLGALMPYRAAAEVLADFLPGQMATRHTTLRHRTLTVGKRLEEKEEQRMLFEQVDT